MFRINLASRRELKQQRPTAKATKLASLKNEFGLLPNLSHLFHLVKCWQILWELTKGRFRKRKESRCFVFTSSTKREVRHFHFVVQRRGKQRKITATLSSLSFASLLVLLPFVSVFFFFGKFYFQKRNITLIWSFSCICL